MFSNSSKFCVVTLMLLAMISCGGKVESELTAAENQIQVQKIQNLQVVGLWRSPESATGFEFFSSVINGPEASGLKTGRVLDGNSVKHQFWWTASADGKIQLNLVSPNCNARPLSYCEASEQVTITARGDNAKSSIWTIEYDQDYDNISDRTDVYPYTKELIGIEDFSHNELYLQESEYFAFATRLDVSGTQVSVHLIHLDETLVAHGELMAAGADLVQLATTEDASVIESQSFYVEGVGYRDLEVQKTYQNVVLRKSSGNGFSVAYDIETEVLIPAELDGLRIDTGSTQERVSFTRVGNTVGDFLTESRVSNGMIAAGKQFVTFIPYLFNDEIVLLGAGNRLSFNTDEAGSLSRDDINAGENARAVNFTWQENDGGELLLTLDGGDTVGIRFVKPITGGYQVLYSIDSEEHGEAYVIHDLFESKLRMDMSDQIPGKFSIFIVDPEWFRRNGIVL